MDTIALGKGRDKRRRQQLKVMVKGTKAAVIKWKSKVCGDEREGNGRWGKDH